MPCYALATALLKNEISSFACSNLLQLTSIAIFWPTNKHRSQAHSIPYSSSLAFAVSCCHHGGGGRKGFFEMARSFHRRPSFWKRGAGIHTAAFYSRHTSFSPRRSVTSTIHYRVTVRAICRWTYMYNTKNPPPLFFVVFQRDGGVLCSTLLLVVEAVMIYRNELN